MLATTCWIIVFLGLVCASHAEVTTPNLPEKHFPFLDKYCLECHDSLMEEGKVNLEEIPFQVTTLEEAELWQKVLNSMNSGEMPPEDEKQPEQHEKADFLDALAQTMVDARRSLSDSGGEITMRRLNRREYQNSMASLMGFEIDVSTLPSDGGGSTFDTEGASQFISSDQIEQYLKLGRSAVGEWLERRAAAGQPAKVFRVEPENTVNVQSRKEMAEQEETYQRYLGWKAGVDKAALLPENEKALAQIREKYGLDDLTDSVRLYQNASLLTGTPDPKEFGFRDDNAASFSYQGGYGRTHAYRKQYLEFPNSDRGTYLKLAWAIQRIDVVPDPKDVPPGTYKLKIRAGSVEGSDPSRHFIEVGHPQRVNGVPFGFTTKPIASLQVTGTEENPEIIETNVVINSDTPREFGIQERVPSEGRKAINREYFAYKKENGYGTPPAIWVDWIELEGPIPDAATVTSKLTRIEPEETINPANDAEIANIEDEYARSAEWQKGVDEAIKTPENQAKIAEIRKTEPKIDHPQWFYAYAEQLEGTPDAKDFGFRDSQKAAAGDPEGDRRNLAYHKHYASLPHRDRGSYLKLAHGTGRVIVAPEEMPPGSYTLRVAAAAVEGSPASRHFIEVGHPQRLIDIRNWGLEGEAISSHQVTGTIDNPQVIEIPLEVGTDTIKEFAIQEKQPNNGNLKALWNAHNALKAENGYGHPPAIWIDWVELEGPHPATPTSWTQRREVEEQANRRITGVFNGYFKGGHDAGKAFLKTGEPQPKAGVKDEQEAKFRIRRLEREGPTWQRYLDNPLTKTGSLLTIFNPHKEEFIPFPPEQVRQWHKIDHEVDQLPAGDYNVRFRIGAIEGTPQERHFVDLGAVPSEGEFNHLATYQVTGTTEKPQVIEARVQLTGDGPRLFSIREKRDQQHDVKVYNKSIDETGLAPEPALWIDWVEWEGPLSGSANDATFTDWWVDPQTTPDDSQRAREIFEKFAFTAFRGVAAEDDFLDRLASLYETRRAAGDSFEEALELPLAVLLSSPGFLYFNEPNEADERRQLNDRELAVRLAYFLWSSPPDEELLSLAQRGELNNPDILRSQVDRLIADPRSDEFVAGFLHQWLDMERLDFFQFDTNLYRDFDESTRSAARQEVYQTFAHILRTADGNLGQLLKSDYVFVNGLLATYYDLEGVTGDQFQKVALPAESPRGGLLGMAAIHAMGSDGIESSPVERGAWVLRHLLNDPPPPAPPNVPQLSRLADQPLTTRQKLAAHMEEAQCASCHRKIDPIGFGLENFDAAGKWRTEEGHGKDTHPIDPADQFHNGPEFNDYFELRDIIADREPDFARGFAEHLIGYGLGRPFGFTDEDLANEIVGAAKEESYTVNAFVQALVASEAFRRK